MTRQRNYDQDRRRLRAELERLRHRIESGDDDEIVAWLIPRTLAGAHRPLRYDPDFGGRGPEIPVEAMSKLDKWLSTVIASGVRTVMCLGTSEELKRYDSLRLGARGLLGWLEAGGLDVRHLPLRDPAHLPLGEGASWKTGELQPVQREAAACFPELTPPVLLFCSGGADRTPPVAAYIAQTLNE